MGILNYYRAMEPVLNPIMYRFIESSYHQNCFDRYIEKPRSIKTIGLFGERKCHRPTLNVQSENKFDMLIDSVLCPWYYDLTYDVNRRPRMIPQARCRCTKCKGLSNKYCQEFGLEQTVVRRANTGSESKWIPTLEWLYVACLCVERS